MQECFLGKLSGVFKGYSHVVALDETQCHCWLQVIFKVSLLHSLISSLAEGQLSSGQSEVVVSAVLCSFFPYSFGN